MALKTKAPLVALVIVLFLTLLSWLVSPATAQAQTQSLSYTLSWTNGAVLPDNSNRPDVTIIQQRVRAAGSTTFTAWADIGSVPFPQNTFVDKISNDPGARTICYQVAHRNVAGTSAFTPEACTITPTVLKIPLAPNEGKPVIIIIGPVTVP
jgi:hypothetical protein